MKRKVKCEIIVPYGGELSGCILYGVDVKNAGGRILNCQINDPPSGRAPRIENLQNPIVSNNVIKIKCSKKQARRIVAVNVDNSLYALIHNNIVSMDSGVGVKLGKQKKSKKAKRKPRRADKKR